MLSKRNSFHVRIQIAENERMDKDIPCCLSSFSATVTEYHRPGKLQIIVHLAHNFRGWEVQD
jgi:hypothetical protein